MKFSIKIFFIAYIALAASLQGCRQKENSDKYARFRNNTAEILVDESFSPIVDEELYIFKYSNPKDNPRIVYAPENTVINMLMADSARVFMLSRELTPAEQQYLLKTRNMRPVSTRFAIDAIAVIVNQASTDTNMTVSEIKKMLNGDTKTDKNIVFDNPNSGLVRYLKAFAGVNEFKQKNIYSLKSNKEVIEYVSQHPNAIGIAGFTWLNDPDKDYADAVAKVKIVGIKDDTGKDPSGQYYTPSQTTLALKQYPLSRDLYILNGTGDFSLGKRFADFIRGDRGQRIILKSGILPENIPPRHIAIETKHIVFENK